MIQSQFIVRNKVKQIEIKASRRADRVRSACIGWCVIYTRIAYEVNWPGEAMGRWNGSALVEIGPGLATMRISCSNYCTLVRKVHTYIPYAFHLTWTILDCITFLSDCRTSICTSIIGQAVLDYILHSSQVIPWLIFKSNRKPMKMVWSYIAKLIPIFERKG